MSTVDIVTFGCRLNAFESEVIRGAAGQAGVADAIIVNTCAVTAEAERQARQAIRRARREHPGRRIIVTGCAATLSPHAYAAMPEVDLVLDNTAKLKAESYRAALHPDPFPAAGEKERAGVSPPHLIHGQRGAAAKPRTGEGSVRTRAYLQIQQGCDHRCTFCIIPYARGPNRSLPLTEIVSQARTLAAAGVKEVVLTGVDLTAHGADLPHRPSLGRVARELLAAVPELPRLRLSSLDPSEIDAELWDLIGSEPRLMPHLHLSLQAGDDLILKRMKRRHSRADAIACARRARELRPELAIGADLIAGFPTETEDMFRRSLDIIDECGIAFLHVFPYSARPGTPAARMPAIDPGIVRERAARLRAAAAAALTAELSSRIDAVDEILVERPGRGRATFYAEIECPETAAAGSLVSMRFAAVRNTRLVGEPIA